MNTKTEIKELKVEKLIDLSAFAKNWKAPYVERQELKKFSGGALNARTMANHDSKGQGIKGRINIGRKVLYPVNEVIAWMEARASLPKKGRVGQEGRRV
ncbi:MAG: hypothetical protein D3922_07545 [Candidatus Electrothrix sp. AR1]|nr:hypothetical protein [Candidatus Electrothrix sp. AR1]